MYHLFDRLKPSFQATPTKCRRITKNRVRNYEKEKGTRRCGIRRKAAPNGKYNFPRLRQPAQYYDLCPSRRRMLHRSRSNVSRISKPRTQERRVTRGEVSPGKAVERSNRVLFPKLDATWPDFVSLARHHFRPSVNDSDYIRVHLLRKPLTVVRSFVRSLPLVDRIYSRTHGVTQKCGLFCAMCFEVARNSHPRNANYLMNKYARMVCPNNAPTGDNKAKIKRTLARDRFALRFTDGDLNRSILRKERNEARR